jgi:hypothetical protein
VWKCVIEDGQRVLVKTKPWIRRADLSYAHTESPSRATVTITANVPLAGCRLVASDPRLLGVSGSKLSGRTARRTLDTSGTAPGVYSLKVTCPNSKLNQSGDLLVRRNGSALLRSDCMDAWHDTRYADVVPGYGRRMSPESVPGTKTECKQLAPLMYDEYQRVHKEAYLQVGRIAEREVRRVSVARGIPICEAIGEVFKTVDALGRLSQGSTVEPNTSGPAAGYRPDGFFPVLTRQWTDGPFRLHNIAGCGGGNQGLSLINAMWTLCDIPGMVQFGGDINEMYPAFDPAKCPSSIDTAQLPNVSVCIVWGDGLGNDVIGGVGKVFSPEGQMVNGTYDCQKRLLHTGEYVYFSDKAVPPLD